MPKLSAGFPLCCLKRVTTGDLETSSLSRQGNIVFQF